MKHRISLLLMVLLSTIAAHAIRLKAYLPASNPTGTAIIICPGGSYFWLDADGEGRQVAQWLQSNGIAAFVLKYSHGGWAAFAFHMRLPGRKFPAAHNELCAAIDSIRKHADSYGIRQDRIGCMGFSAGGHLVMQTALQRAGHADNMNFVVPLYPVVSMTAPCTHRRSRRGLLGEFPSRILKDSLSLENHVTKACPPVFLMNCDDDPIVDHHNAELLDSALTVHGVPHQYEHYSTGGHGFGVNAAKTSAEAIQWKDRFLAWLKQLQE